MKYNPFIPDSIADPSMFAGRVSEIEKVKRSLFQAKHGNPAHLLLTGERGIGKSSLMNYVYLMARGKVPVAEEAFNFLTVSTDLSGVECKADVIEVILRELRSALNSIDALRNKAKKAWDFLSRWEALGVSYNAPVTDASTDSALDDLVSVLNDIASTRGCDGVAVLMDEADSPPASADLGSLLKIITERLARRECRKVNFTIAGQLSIVDKLRESHESSLRIFTMLDLQPLTNLEQREVVLRGMRLANEKNLQTTNIEDRAVERLAELSEGYPHFIQQYSYSAFEADVDDLITVKDVEEGAYSENGAIWSIGKKYFDSLYFSKISSDQYRKVLRFMVSFGDSWVSRKQILDSSEVDETTANNALQALKQREIIVSDSSRRGYYKLPTQSFAVWISTVAEAPGE